MPLMEPRSPWASTHGEKTSIPSIRIDLAEFGIGKLLSCGRLTSNTRANSPVPFLLGRNLTRLQEQVKSKGCGQCARSACAGVVNRVQDRIRKCTQNPPPYLSAYSLACFPVRNKAPHRSVFVQLV